ncbi:ATP/GTP-binding protein [Streptomyces sp. NPDC005925]|uniref:ATP/GTP-binding protein n=1 Tax=Streptomyces sp. NPDC005925 TaxID=3157172 RepID=UPI003401D2FD
MDTDGTHDARGTHADRVPRPASPAQPPPGGPPPVPPAPPVPLAPPMPQGVPGAAPAVAAWLDEPRPEAGVGIWRLGFTPGRPGGAKQRLDPSNLMGAVIPLVVALILWSMWKHGVVPYQWVPLKWFTPGDWWYAGTVWPQDGVWQGLHARIVYDGAAFLLLVLGAGRLGSWPKVIRFYLDRHGVRVRVAATVLAALAVLGFVWPETVPGEPWKPLPVVDPVLSLVALVTGGVEVFQSQLITYGLYALITAAVLWPFARIGDWWTLTRQWLGARSARRSDEPRAAAPLPPAQWPRLREAGQHRAADVLTAEVLGGRMNDVDCVRVGRAWTRARRDAARVADFAETVLRAGATAWTHPSGDRDLPTRTARHDLLVGQVRIGSCVASGTNPPTHQGAGVALDPSTLGTSLLAVGPSGVGKTRGLVRPVVETLALQALTGSCAVVAVGGAGAALGPDGAYDVVVRLGDPASVHDLDLYADSTDPDEAASFLAEGLVGDLDGVDSRRAATALAQLLGPYRAVHGRFPAVPALRELLEGDPDALTALRGALDEDVHPAMRRELDARIRQAGTAADPGPALADRLALLDRPVFERFFGAGDARHFSLRSLARHPLRVRVDLPERGHEEASRLLTRLVLAQFTAVARADGARGHFACLVLDDAAGALTTETIRGIQRLRSVDAGVVLTLRTLAEVPEALHGPLFSAVGCRMAFSGVTTWDGRAFAEAWGKEWIETEEVAQHTVFADQPMTRALHALRKMVTGRAVTTEAVTVRQVERERWSASELAHSVPPGHAVLSLTDVRGEHAPPLLVDLRG